MGRRRIGITPAPLRYAHSRSSNRTTWCGSPAAPSARGADRDRHFRPPRTAVSAVTPRARAAPCRAFRRSRNSTRRLRLSVAPPQRIAIRNPAASHLGRHHRRTRRLVGAAHIGFVGGSFGMRGGQNMIEPAAYGVATCFGPNTWNFRDIVSVLLTAQGAEVVEDAPRWNDSSAAASKNRRWPPNWASEPKRWSARNWGRPAGRWTC